MRHTLKQAILKSFSRAATTYESWATVQRETAGLLLKAMPDCNPKCILEIGCGTGLYTKLLMERFKNGHITAVDISFAMAKQAKDRLQEEVNSIERPSLSQLHEPPRVTFLCADGERLPFSPHKTHFDLITSNSAFHWFQEPSMSIKDIYDLLPYGGILHFSFFGPQSLMELQYALKEKGVETYQIAASSFLNKEQLNTILSGISPNSQLAEITLKRQYEDIFHLLRSLKMTGVAPFRSKRTSSETGPLRMSHKGLKDIERCYKDKYGAIYASYQVFICTIFKE